MKQVESRVLYDDFGTDYYLMYPKVCIVCLVHDQGMFLCGLVDTSPFLSLATVRSLPPPQNCTDHAIMLFTHPDRNYKPSRLRGGRLDRRDPTGGARINVGGRGGTIREGHGFFDVGGNAFTGNAFLSGGGGVGVGKTVHHAQGGSHDVVGSIGDGSMGDDDVTLVHPGKVSG